MAVHNPFAQYRTVQFNTADQGILILKSYEGAIRFCKLGKQAIESGDFDAKAKHLTRAFDIVGELRKALRVDLGGKTAEVLSEAYVFISRQITLGNVMSAVENIDNALTVLDSLHSAWEEIVKKERAVNSTLQG